ncbi:very low-density lipoprotein receptor-like isoform X2 [Ptychodera flava]|uniref:very low-density lipoprotein receptor-like isoform X2 n=1 Tax=Ptychodera flava TaxID=63121 RepID=UPI00396A02F5
MSRICLVPCLLIAAVCVTFPQMADAACNSVTQYQCDSGRCIPLYWRCDTILNCDDGDDEQGCDTATCLSPYFPYRCPSGKCIAESWVCDLYFRIDCPDGADQKNCANIDCTEPYVWQCADTVCIMKDKKCNGNVDCPDESDEAGCDTPNCAEDEFTCNSGACIASDKVCDQVADCPGKQQEDEENCSGPRTCDEFSFRCNNGVCILRNLQCDTVEHCKDGEDEECGSYCHQCDGWYDTDHQCHPDSYTYPIESACDKGKICSSTLKKNAQGELRYNVGCKGKSYCNNLQSENPAACSSDPSSIGADEKCTFCCEANLCNRYDSLPSPPTEVTTTAG